MAPKKLKKIWQSIEAGRKNLPKLADLEALAKKCGRQPYAGGKHVMWMSIPFPQHRAFPIPRHGGDPVAGYAVRDTVLDHLEADAAAWEELINRDDGNEVSVDGDGDGTE